MIRTRSTFALRLVALTSLLAMSPLVVGCTDATYGASAKPGELSGRLVITGSSTVAPLVGELAARFEGRHPRTRIDVQSGGSSRGITDARRGMADIGMASRALTTAELAGLAAYPIARDGVCVIVNADNLVAELTDAQLRAIFVGEIRNWSEVGGPDARITVVSKASGRATLAVFLRYFGLAERDIDADVIVGENAQGVKIVAGNPHAIGYVSIGAAEVEAHAGVAIKLLPLDGVAATTANVASGEFAMSRPLNLVTRGAASGLAAAFIQFCQSEDARATVRDLHFVPFEGLR